MVITFGVMLHIGKAVATAIPPPQQIIEGTVVGKPTQDVKSISTTQNIQHYQKNKHHTATANFSTYSSHGKQQLYLAQTGINVDIFA